MFFPRFGFFCGAASEYLKVRNVKPDILHCHDWQSAPVAWGERPNRAKCVFTIHNLNYGADLVGRAMATAEVATTVSPTYAREVGETFGCLQDKRGVQKLWFRMRSVTKLRPWSG